MAVLGGGMWGGINQGLRDLDQAAIDQKKMDVMDAEVTARNRGLDLQAEQVGMQRDLHGIKMDENKRDNEVLKIADIQKSFGDKNPSAYNYGVDHAARNGFIQTDPATGEQTIRRKDLNQTMAHLDTAQGVEEISKRDIALYTDKLRAATDPSEIKDIEGKLLQAKTYNKGALEYLKIEEAAKQKALDRASEERRAAISAADKPGMAELRSAQAEHYGQLNKALKEGGTDKGKAEAALSKFLTSDDFSMQLGSLQGPARAAKEKQLVDGFVRNYTTGRDALKGRLGGGAYAPIKGATYKDITDLVVDAPSTSEAADRLSQKYGYSTDQAIEILKASRKAGYLK